MFWVDKLNSSAHALLKAHKQDFALIRLTSQIYSAILCIRMLAQIHNFKKSIFDIMLVAIHPISSDLRKTSFSSVFIMEVTLTEF